MEGRNLWYLPQKTKLTTWYGVGGCYWVRTVVFCWSCSFFREVFLFFLQMRFLLIDFKNIFIQVSWLKVEIRYRTSLCYPNDKSKNDLHKDIGVQKENEYSWNKIPIVWATTSWTSQILECEFWNFMENYSMMPGKIEKREFFCGHHGKKIVPVFFFPSLYSMSFATVFLVIWVT